MHLNLENLGQLSQDFQEVLIFMYFKKRKCLVISTSVPPAHGCFAPIWLEKKNSFFHTHTHTHTHTHKIIFLKISIPLATQPLTFQILKGQLVACKEKIWTQTYQPPHIFLTIQNNPKYAYHFVMNGCVSLKFLKSTILFT